MEAMFFMVKRTSWDNGCIAPSERSPVRFGDFEGNFATGELIRRGLVNW
jgi:hypothetical protein